MGGGRETSHTMNRMVFVLWPRGHQRLGDSQEAAASCVGFGVSPKTIYKNKTLRGTHGWRWGNKPHDESYDVRFVAARPPTPGDSQGAVAPCAGFGVSPKTIYKNKALRDHN